LELPDGRWLDDGIKLSCGVLIVCDKPLDGHGHCNDATERERFGARKNPDIKIRARRELAFTPDDAA
jgi:hypothetical protein